jgi:uncharacterized RDD family membrane protein YckC
MNTPSLTLQSVTGVDVELQIAGAGSRSFAFVIDWHIRLLLAGFWFVVVATAMGLWSESTVSGRPLFIWLGLVIPLAIYFLYHPVLEVLMRGRTPGKRIAGIRIVTQQGEIPSVGVLLVRNLFRIIDSLPTLYTVGLGFAIFTGRHLRLGDMAAGTLLVIDAAESEQSLNLLGHVSQTGSAELTPQAFELVHELLERWPALEMAERVKLGRALLLKIDTQTPPEEIAGLSPSGVQERLRQMLAQGTAT